MTGTQPVAINKLFDFYIKSSLHVSLAVTAFAWVTAISFQLVVNPVLYGFIFSSTLVSYNGIKYLPLLQKDFIAALKNLKRIAAITVCGAALTAWTAFLLDLWTLVAAVLLGGITTAYALPVFQNSTNLRQVYGIKIAVIALVWAGVTVGLPVLDQDSQHLSISTIAIEHLQRFFYVIVLILPFDIRDLHYDKPSLGTLPQMIGVRNSKIAGSVLLASVVLLEVFQSPMQSAQFTVLVLIVLLTAALVWKSMAVQADYFASFWVEGLPILWAAALFAFL